MSGADVIVIGGGHNGLTCAASLAKAGRRVTVVEQNPELGGVASAWEFHPGFRSPGVLHDTSTVRASIADALNLTTHGLKLRPHRAGILALGEPGDALWIDGDRAAAGRSIGQRSPADAAAWERYHGFLDRVGRVVRAFLDHAPPDIIGDVDLRLGWDLAGRAVGMRRLGRKEMMELLRLPSMSAADWLGEHFQDDLLKAALALPAVRATVTGPRAPGSNVNLLLWECAARADVEGGGQALIAALEKALRSYGDRVTLRTGARVERILVEKDAVAGVVLEGGEELRAATVAASCDPKQTLLRLLPAAVAGFGLVQGATHIRARGTMGQVLLAVKGDVRFSGGSSDLERNAERARIGAHLNDLERAHDAIKYRRISETPILDVFVPTRAAPHLAPTGHHVISVETHFAPYALEGGWDDGARERLGHRVVELLAGHVEGLADRIVGRAVLAPPDLESRFGLSGGHPYHGEHALDQILIRPLPQCIGYRTPIPGLFLCGSGSHPGGGLTCAPGALAARAMQE